MKDLPEHAKGEIPELAGLEADIDALEESLRMLRARHQALINARAQAVARFKVGHEYENRNGARFRITKVRGDYYYDAELTKVPITWVRYRGVRLYKNGNEGREETLYPPEPKSVRAVNEPQSSSPSARTVN